MLWEERPLRKRRKLYFEVRNKADVPFCKLFVIGSRGEQHHQREYLQTPEQHLQRQDHLGEVSVSRKVCRGTDEVETGTDVADAGEGSGEVGQKISVRFDRDQKSGDDQDRNPSDEVNAHVVDSGLLNGLALEFYRDYFARVDHLADIRGGGLDQDQEAGHLDAAGGAARHTARDHQEKQDAFGEGRPGVVVNGGEARRGREGKHLEGGVPQRRTERGDRRGGGIEDICRDGKDRQDDHNDEGDGFLALERL